VEDEFGRITPGEFEIPVGPALTETDYGDATQFSRARYYVASKNETIYHKAWCYLVCYIPRAEMLLFSEMRHAESTGRAICPRCAGEQPGPCLCSSPYLDCEDFETQDAAQSCYEYCKSKGYGDIHGLDPDGDSIACDDLP
jgi:hypothetical protein